MVPEEGIGLVVLANLSSSQLQTALMYRVFDALLGVPETDWSGEFLALSRRSAERSTARSAERDAARVEGTRPSLPLDEYTGTYRDRLFGDVRVTMQEGGLVLHYSTDYVADLGHWHYDTFRATWRREGYGHDDVTFALDATGAVRDLTIPGFATFRKVDGSPDA
jgi:hypothetical protein